jgi:thioredoxin-like negative regulator of GroEL
VIERVLIAGVILALLVAAGFVAKWLTHNRQASLLEKVEAASSPTATTRVISFSGPGCAACKSQRRILDSVVAEWGGQIEVDYVDAAVDYRLAKQYGVFTVPTTVIAAPDGRIIAINGGLADAEKLRAQLAAA